jgi:hypothetical protein
METARADGTATVSTRVLEDVVFHFGGMQPRRSSAPDGLRSDPVRRLALRLLQPASTRQRDCHNKPCIAEEADDMTNRNRLVTFFAAGVLGFTVAAHARDAMAPDPNLGPSMGSEATGVAGTATSSPQLAADPDPNVGPSTSDAEAEIPGTSPNDPQLATPICTNLGAPARPRE